MEDAEETRVKGMGTNDSWVKKLVEPMHSTSFFLLRLSFPFEKSNRNSAADDRDHRHDGKGSHHIFSRQAQGCSLQQLNSLSQRQQVREFLQHGGHHLIRKRGAGKDQHWEIE